MSARVAKLLVAPVKGLRVSAREEVRIGPAGVLENRRFLLVDGRGQVVTARRVGALQTVVADYSHDDRELVLHFPDGRVVAGQLRLGETLEVELFHGPAPARIVEGPWSAALSEHIGKPLRLAESAADEGAVDRGGDGAVSLISRATLDRVAAEGKLDGALDARRFRMLFEVDGVAAHEEDDWIGRPLRLGEAVISLVGHTGRCVITTRDPESGVSNLPTLKLLGRYRRHTGTTERLGCGVHGTVVTPGIVRVGDAVELI